MVVRFGVPVAKLVLIGKIDAVVGAESNHPSRSLPFTNEFTNVSAPLWTAAQDPESASEPERSSTSMALTSLRETCAVAETDKVFQCRIFMK